MQPKISIIVPVYNGEKYIETFIKCIEHQKYKEFEIIFVDDGSIDNTFNICNEYAKKDNRIHVYHKKNGGPSSARNLGIDRSTGDYVVFFDIDDEFSDDILSDNVQLATDSNADVVMWNFKMICMNNGSEIIRKVGNSVNVSKEEFFSDVLFKVLDNEMFNPPWNKLIKRSVLLENNVRFDERFSIYEDILFSYQLIQKADRISVNDNVYYDYVIKEEGSLLTKFHSECFKVIMEILSSALKYADLFDDNKAQSDRFKKQAIYLTKGFIKQICVNKGISYKQKKSYLAEIAENGTYSDICRTIGVGKKAIPARELLKHKLYGCLIFYYNFLDALC